MLARSPSACWGGPLLLLAVLFACLSCERNPTDYEQIPVAVLTPLFSSGLPESTACGKGTSWDASAPHYGNEINLVEEGVDSCGALSFNSQTGRWAGYYDFSESHYAGGWSTWRRLYRNALSGEYSDSIAQHRQIDADTVDVAFVLDLNFDLVGLQHHIEEVDSATPPIGATVEAWAQIWRYIPNPGIESVRVSYDSVIIVFDNNSHKRDIDSTLVQHRPQGGSVWYPRGSVGEDATTFNDTQVSPGTYTYRLKHVAPTVPTGIFYPAPPRPNSGWVSTVVSVGFPAPSDLWCDDTLVPSARCFWANGTDTAVVEVERNGAIHDTLPAGTDSLVHTDVAFDDSLTYFVRHVSLIDNSFSKWSDPGAVRVTPTAPQGLVCGSGTEEVEVSCGWSPGEVYDTTEIWRRLDGSSWQVLTKFQPGKSQYFDQNVEEGEIYWYKVRHRRNSVLTGFSNADTAYVHTDPFPIPGRRKR